MVPTMVPYLPENKERKKERNMLECDYLVVGAGATGMAFADTLLSTIETARVVLIDYHQAPGGQWNDSYDFVRLHQPSTMYGVESEPLELGTGAERTAHRATRAEILAYYRRVQSKWEKRGKLQFLGGTFFDFDTMQKSDNNVYTLNKTDSVSESICVHKRIVDARFLQPDLPINTPPKFLFPEKVKVVPVNDIVHCESQHYVVLGGGKTGMDSVVYLQSIMGVDPSDIIWVVPNEAWITARENMASCMEFLHTCTEEAKRLGKGSDSAYIHSNEFLQNGFLKLESQGKVYRFSKDILPPKFKDATLSVEEMDLIKKVTNVVRNGRVQEISDQGVISFSNGVTETIPWPVEKTTFIHCTAGAFNYTKQPGGMPKIFDGKLVTIQDVYGTPGFCFVGSVIAKMETCTLSDSEKNAMLLSPLPRPLNTQQDLLGPSGGDIGHLTADHGLIQRLRNVRAWYKIFKSWLEHNRLFNLNLANKNSASVASMLAETWQILEPFFPT